MAMIKKVTLTPAKRQVAAKWEPERIGIILTEGQEVSEVRWNDDKSTSYIPNPQLINATEEKMSVSQVQEYNNLVAKALELGLKATSVKKFKDSVIGEKRLVALRALIDSQTGESTPSAEQQPEAPEAIEAPIEEAVMAKKSKSKKVVKKTKSKKPTAAKQVSNGDGMPREGTKAADLYNLMTRKSGFTQADANKLTGWKSVNVTLQAKLRGITLRREKTENGSRYYAE